MPESGPSGLLMLQQRNGLFDIRDIDLQPFMRPGTMALENGASMKTGGWACQKPRFCWAIANSDRNWASNLVLSAICAFRPRPKSLSTQDRFRHRWRRPKFGRN